MRTTAFASRNTKEIVRDPLTILFGLGFQQLRVRIHGDVARIEILPEEFDRLMDAETRSLVYERLKDYGFRYVTLDLRGYRSGSMNEVLT